jgi:hypothetical protein
MVLTQKEAKVAFAHVLDNYNGRNYGNALMSKWYYEGIDDTFGLIRVTDITFDFRIAMQYHHSIG